jgi:chromosome segregation protein
VDRELEAVRQQRGGADTRVARLNQEAGELRAGLTQSGEDTESAARDLESLFEERTRLEREARELDERVEEVRKKVADLEVLLRRVHQEERGHSERRHELELERTQIDADLHRTRERLEDEWGRSFDELAGQVEPAAGEHDELREELHDVAERLANIGLVNMLAEQEYQEESERFEFLQAQREDLAKARDDLRETIRQINETASAALLETLDQIRANFRRTFQTLFQGGECDVWLEDPSDPLDSPIEISASPRGKRTQRIHLLSGGERALTALSLLFAIYLVKPSPFCVLDEVDAPLDETNILRFVAMLEEFKSSVQFIVITHNPVTIEAADWIYGVTMEEPGVSKIVGVEFSDYARGAVA